MDIINGYYDRDGFKKYKSDIFDKILNRQCEESGRRIEREVSCFSEGSLQGSSLYVWAFKGGT